MSNQPNLPSKEFSGSPRPTSQQQTVKVPLPESFQSLPTTEISKLSSSLNVLKGYLITLISKELQQDIEVLNGIIRDIETFLNKLHQLETSKQETNSKLSNYQSLLQTWEFKEKQMYQSLSRFNNQSIHKLLTSSIIDSKKLATSIQQSFVNHIDVHDEQSIQKFIQVYQKEQKSYHLRQEKLQRLYENRVNGIYL